MPSFGRALGLPSAGSIPIRALRRGCDSVNVHGAVRPAIASSSRAPGAASCDARGIRSCHPRPSPRLPACSSPCFEHVGSQTGFCGLAAAYRSLQRMIDARARPRAVNPPCARGSRLCPRSGPRLSPCPISFPVRGRENRQLVSPAPDVSIERELRHPVGWQAPSGTTRPGF